MNNYNTSQRITLIKQQITEIRTKQLLPLYATLRQLKEINKRERLEKQLKMYADYENKRRLIKERKENNRRILQEMHNDRGFLDLLDQQNNFRK